MYVFVHACALLCVCVCAYVQAIQVNTGAKGGQEKALDPPRTRVIGK